jgi:hypothetical protein
MLRGGRGWVIADSPAEQLIDFIAAEIQLQERVGFIQLAPVVPILGLVAANQKTLFDLFFSKAL